MTSIRAAFCLALLGGLSACGGGGGGEAPTPIDPVSFNVGGTLAGLGAGRSVTLAHADGAGATVQSATLNANGSYGLRLPAGTAYSLRVLVQPVGQTCTVSNGTGTAGADVDNIAVVCADDIVAPEAKVISGSVSGLSDGKNLVLQLTVNGTTQDTSVNTDGNFSFPQAITGSYAVTVKTPPTGQSCTVANSQGTAGEGLAVSVSCASVAFKLGGTVTGNLGVVALRNASSGETVALNSSGAFSFTQPVLQGGAYSVAVFDQSASQNCSVANGSGTANADVTNIQVSCQAVVVVAPPAPPAASPSVPAGLTMTYNVKSFKLAWGTVTAPVGGGTVSYKLFEDADGAGPAASTQIGGTLTGVTFTQVVTGLLHTRLNAQYKVQACNTVGCSTLTAAITPNITQAIGYFKASNTRANDYFGWSVALSSDGSTLAVGAYGEGSGQTGTFAATALPADNNSSSDAGAVYIYTQIGGLWVPQAYVKASNSGAGDQFGQSVALSRDGSTLAVGADQESSGHTGTFAANALPADNNSASSSGAVYVYTRTDGLWAQQAYVKASNTGARDLFGNSVALSGDGSTLAVGARDEGSRHSGTFAASALPADNNSAPNSGAVYVYTRTGVDWAQQAYVKASNTGASDWFGLSVALSGDGHTLAVGASLESSGHTGTFAAATLPADNNSVDGSGAVYVYTRAGALWAPQAYVKASNTGTDDYFGYSVALSGDGNTLAVGAYGEDSGSTGTFAATALPADNNSANQSGAVYVYTRTDGLWAQQAYVKASNTGGNDLFGYSVALSRDGNTLAVAGRQEDSGHTGTFAATALPPDNDNVGNSGAVYVYTRTIGIWAHQAYVKASNSGASDLFGNSLALSGDGNTLVVGAAGEDSSATGIGGNQADNSAANAGAAYVY